MGGDSHDAALSCQVPFFQSFLDKDSPTCLQTRRLPHFKLLLFPG